MAIITMEQRREEIFAAADELMALMDSFHLDFGRRISLELVSDPEVHMSAGDDSTIIELDPDMVETMGFFYDEDGLEYEPYEQYEEGWV